MNGKKKREKRGRNKRKKPILQMLLFKKKGSKLIFFKPREDQPFIRFRPKIPDTKRVV